MRSKVLLVLLGCLLVTSARAPFLVAQAFDKPYTVLESVRPMQVPEIDTYRRFDPPARYNALYWDAIRCSGAYGEIPLFKHIVWLEGPDGFKAPPRLGGDGAGLGGLTVMGDGPPDTIVIAKKFRNTDWMVKHELIHFVLQMPHPKLKVVSDSIWGIACQATWGFLPADTVKSGPGVTSTGKYAPSSLGPGELRKDAELQ